MRTTNNDVTVIVPMRNSEATVADTMESLLAQTRKDFELIVSDNGSSDRSKEIVQSYASKFERFRLIDSSKSPGSGFARRCGVETAQGDVLIFVDSDDMVSPNYVEAMSAAIERHGFVHGSVEMKRLNPGWVTDIRPGQGTATSNVGGWKYAGSATLGVRREHYDAVGGFCTEPEIAEDNDFCFRMRHAGHDLQGVDDAFVHVRQKFTFQSALKQGRYYGRCHAHTNRLWRPYGFPVESEWTVLPRAVKLWRPRQLLSLRSPGGRYVWAQELGMVLARTKGNVIDVVTRRKFRSATGLIRPSEDPFLEEFRELYRAGLPR